MIIVASLSQFIQEYFFNNQPGYNIVNTLFFGLILGLTVLTIIKMFKWIDKDPKEFLIPLVPFIFLGSSTRALVDIFVYPFNLLLVTPGIYIITGFITIFTIIGAVYIEQQTGRDYRYIIFFTGLVLCIPNLINLQSFNWVAFSAVIIIWAAFTLCFFMLGKKWDLLQDKFNLSVLSAHLFDASSTFIAVDFYGYWEQHVLPGALISRLGTAAIMFPLKITVILAAIYLIDFYIEDKTVRNVLKLSIFILGLAPGLRNLLSLSMGT